MKPIKFRAWDSRNNQMHHRLKIKFGLKGTMVLVGASDNEVDRWLTLPNNVVKLMQFTGLLDKNKKEVYEGDILRVKCLDKYHTEIFEAVIQWYQPECLYHLQEKTSHGYRYWGTQQTESIEIIGNIYESPELISKP